MALAELHARLVLRDVICLRRNGTAVLHPCSVTKAPTKREARAAYDAFVAQVPLWLEEFIAEAASSGGPSPSALDGSLESLDAVAGWVAQRHANGDDWDRLLRGWTAYFVFCIQTALPTAQWVFWERRDDSHHQPVLSGFSTALEVQVVARTSLWRFLKDDPPSRPMRDLAALHHAVETWVSRAGPTIALVDAAQDVEIVDLDDGHWTFLLQLASEPDPLLIQRIEQIPGVEEVMHEDREAVLVRATPDQRDRVRLSIARVVRPAL